MSRRVLAIAALVLVFSATAVVAVIIWPDRGGKDSERAATTTTTPGGTRSQGDAANEADGIAGNSSPDAAAPGLRGTPRGVQEAAGAISRAAGTEFALQPAGELAVHPRMKHPPAAGVLFDVDSGQVLWERHPT